MGKGKALMGSGPKGLFCLKEGAMRLPFHIIRQPALKKSSINPIDNITLFHYTIL
jgi:hypothetical protein